MARSRKAWDLEASSMGLVTEVNPSIHTTSQELMHFASRAMTSRISSNSVRFLAQILELIPLGKALGIFRVYHLICAFAE